MRPETDSMSENPLNREIDERIHRILSEAPKPEGPTAIRSRVVARIRRRRMGVRVACAAIVIVLLSIAGLISPWQSKPGANTTPIARQDDTLDAWLETLDTTLLSGPPPVVALDLVARDQDAILDHLKSLDGVQK